MTIVASGGRGIAELVGEASKLDKGRARAPNKDLLLCFYETYSSQQQVTIQLQTLHSLYEIVISDNMLHLG